MSFEILHGTEEFRQWLIDKGRLTLLGGYKTRSTYRIDVTNIVTRVLIQAPADIGKTREALYLIEEWVKQHRIEENVVIVVPRDLMSIPDPARVQDLRPMLLNRPTVFILDDVPLLCTDPGSRKRAKAEIRALLNQFELLALPHLLVVATGRTDHLQNSLGAQYATDLFSEFNIVNLPDFSKSELQALIYQVAGLKRLDVRSVASEILDEIVERAGLSSSENIVQFLESCRLHAALEHHHSFWMRTFGRPFAFSTRISISQEIVKFLTSSSSKTWRNLVYTPAEKNYPEIAALYRAVAVLV
jgi:hypothetical protein